MSGGALRPRSGLRWEQAVSYIAKPPLPRLPHKNLRLKDALQLAKDWGCRMWVANSNDVCITHKLLDGQRRTVPISMSRTDTSQALVSLLRTVASATEDYWKGRIVNHLVPTINEELLEKKRRPVFIDTTERTEPEIQPATSDNNRQPALPEPKAGRPNRPMRIGFRDLMAPAEYVHYRRHCTNGSFNTIWTCDHKDCQRVVEAIEHYETMEEQVEESIAMACKRDDDLKVAQAEIERLKAMIPKDVPAPQPATPLSDDLATVAGRRHFYLNGLNELQRKCIPWPEGHGIATKTRLFEALDMLGVNRRWSPELIDSLRNRNFNTWGIEIQGLKKNSDSVHRLVGRGTWEAFMIALENVKKKEAAGDR